MLKAVFWVPIEDTTEGLVILTTDPERIQASRVVNNIFPKSRLVYRVCPQREFKATLDYFMDLRENRERALMLIQAQWTTCSPHWGVMMMNPAASVRKKSARRQTMSWSNWSTKLL